MFSSFWRLSYFFSVFFAGSWSKFPMQYIHVKVNPGAGKESFKQKSQDHFEISVKEKAERNLANGRVLELTAAHFGVPKSEVRIVNGHRSSSKLLIVGD